MGTFQRVIASSFVLLMFFLLLAACGQRHSKTTIADNRIEENKEDDTLSIFQTLPEAPLITPREANRSNPSYTGYVSGWEKRLNNAYVDTLHQNLKTLVLEDPWMASETAEALRNDIAPKRAPVLLTIKWPSQYKPDNYWKQYSFDSAVALTSFESRLSNQYDCHFGPYCLKGILEASYPIELKDTTIFRPIIRISNKEEGTLYSPLFECFYRGKPFLICSFDVGILKTTDAGAYLWDIIRNYTYSSYFRNSVQRYTRETTRDAWFETLVPGYLQ